MATRFQSDAQGTASLARSHNGDGAIFNGTGQAHCTSHVTTLACILLAGAITIWPSVALALRGKFTCPPAHGTCYFVLYYRSGGTKDFTLEPGKSLMVPALLEGDKYCMDYGKAPPRDCVQKDVDLLY